MNPFRPNQQDHVTEQDLIALHLSELPPARANAVRRMLAKDPALAAESAAIAATLAAVSLDAKGARPMSLDSATVNRNWQAIRPQLRIHTPIPSRWHLPALGGGALAALAAGVAFVAYTHHSAAPDPGHSREPNQIVSQNQAPPESHTPILTASPSGETDPHPGEPGLSATFRSGVYHPRPQDHDGPVRPIGLAPRPEPESSSPMAEPPKQPSLTLLPAPRLTAEPQSPLVAENQAPSEPGRSVNSAGATAHLPGRPRNSHPLDIMLGAGGTFVPERGSLTSKNLSVTHAIVAIGSLHQQFRPALGYRVTLSYTRPDFNYDSSSIGSGGIDSRVFEAAGTYVIQGPHRKRLSTSADAGAALLAFLPDDGAVPKASYEYRAAGILGVNFDYALTKHIGARLGYRAKVFRSPDFHYTGTDIPISTPLIVDNEPFLGVTYTFGKR